MEESGARGESTNTQTIILLLRIRDFRFFYDRRFTIEFHVNYDISVIHGRRVRARAKPRGFPFADKQTQPASQPASLDSPS